MTYRAFVKQCARDFEKVQKKFIRDYRMGTHDRWFYEQDISTITFSRGDTERHFRYLSLGTYSHRSGTWMWSWRNPTTVEPNKWETLKIKRYGERKGFHRLREGQFLVREDEGLEFVAIAHKLLGGLGSYQVPAGNVTGYLLIKELLPGKPTVPELPNQDITCGKHGQQRTAIVCRHLMEGTLRGFEESIPTYRHMQFEDEEDDFTAWCDQCEQLRQRDGGWNDDNFLPENFAAVCEECYFMIKSRNIV